MSDLRTLDVASLRPVVDEQPYPLVFATVSGAHLYGFASRDSDVDLRGVHLLPPADLVGLRSGPLTLDRSWTRQGVEMDLVTHDLTKCSRLLLRRNATSWSNCCLRGWSARATPTPSWWRSPRAA